MPAGKAAAVAVLCIFSGQSLSAGTLDSPEPSVAASHEESGCLIHPGSARLAISSRRRTTTPKPAALTNKPCVNAFEPSLPEIQKSDHVLCGCHKGLCYKVATVGKEAKQCRTCYTTPMNAFGVPWTECNKHSDCRPDAQCSTAVCPCKGKEEQAITVPLPSICVTPLSVCGCRLALASVHRIRRQVPDASQMLSQYEHRSRSRELLVRLLWQQVLQNQGQT